MVPVVPLEQLCLTLCLVHEIKESKLSHKFTLMHILVDCDTGSQNSSL